MWYWYLLGYIAVGSIAVTGLGMWFAIATPIRKGYDIMHWIDNLEFCTELADIVCDVEHGWIGVLWTLLLWPTKLRYIYKKYFPEIVYMYERLLYFEAMKES